ncbi:hypothetical protein AKJ16_DCAP07813 [Drosera capensis]
MYRQHTQKHLDELAVHPEIKSRQCIPNGGGCFWCWVIRVFVHRNNLRCVEPQEISEEVLEEWRQVLVFVFGDDGGGVDDGKWDGGSETVRILSCSNNNKLKLCSFTALDPLSQLELLKLLNISRNEIGGLCIFGFEVAGKPVADDEDNYS